VLVSFCQHTQRTHPFILGAARLRMFSKCFHSVHRCLITFTFDVKWKGQVSACVTNNQRKKEESFPCSSGVWRHGGEVSPILDVGSRWKWVHFVFLWLNSRKLSKRRADPTTKLTDLNIRV
jgi:hypothetical protein